MMEVEDCLLAEDSEELEDGGEHGDISVDLEAPGPGVGINDV